MSDTRITDEASIIAMVKQYDDTRLVYDTALSSVSGASSNLAGQWQSDKAAPVFQNALSDWLGGVRRVKNGLDMLNEAMNGYRQLQNLAEDDATVSAGGWANSGR